MKLHSVVMQRLLICNALKTVMPLVGTQSPLDIHNRFALGAIQRYAGGGNEARPLLGTLLQQQSSILHTCRKLLISYGPIYGAVQGSLH